MRAGLVLGGLHVAREVLGRADAIAHLPLPAPPVGAARADVRRAHAQPQPREAEREHLGEQILERAAEQLGQRSRRSRRARRSGSGFSSRKTAGPRRRGGSRRARSRGTRARRRRARRAPAAPPRAPARARPAARARSRRAAHGARARGGRCPLSASSARWSTGSARGGALPIRRDRVLRARQEGLDQRGLVVVAHDALHLARERARPLRRASPA